MREDGLKGIEGERDGGMWKRTGRTNERIDREKKCNKWRREGREKNEN